MAAARGHESSTPASDYGIAHDEQLVAVVERKSLHDLVRRLIDGQLTYALADLASIPRAAVIVEDRYSNLFKLDQTTPGFVTEMLAALTVRYPTVPIHFAGDGPWPRNGPTGSSAPRSPTPRPRPTGPDDAATGSSLIPTDRGATLSAPDRHEPRMPGPGRNEPCPCGSGRKVKRCRGQSRGPGENDLSRAYLAHQARHAARKLRYHTDDELRDLFDELFELPQLDLALTITLP